MFITDIANSGSIPALATTLRFASERQKLISSNIANLSTPGYQPQDVSIKEFQKVLGDAIDTRRREFGGQRGELKWRETRELRRTNAGHIRLEPRSSGRNILFHDRNNRDLERQLQDLVENAATHRVASELLRSRYDIIRSAISERV